ncbi:MAG: hypothetical protein ACRC10_04770 [Thermoguttaceae bacterium]
MSIFSTEMVDHCFQTACNLDIESKKDPISRLENSLESPLFPSPDEYVRRVQQSAGSLASLPQSVFDELDEIIASRKSVPFRHVGQ